MMDYLRQELFPCNVPLCSKTSTSKADFEKHILMKHSEDKAETWDKVVNMDFDFDDNEDVNYKPVAQSIKAEAKTDAFEFKPIPLNIKTESKVKIPVKIKQNATKVSKSGKTKIGKVQQNLVKNRSEFSIHRIEALTKITLTPEARINFQALIQEGRDQEIYCKIFGNVFWTSYLPYSIKCRNWLCRSCPNNKFLGSREEFEKHFNLYEHGNITYICELCSKTQKTFELIKSHLKNKHFTDAKCDMCEEIFPSNDKMQMHRLKVHQVGGFQCDICTKMCPTMLRLNSHVQENHRNQTFTCSTCMKVFKTKGTCTAHEAIHSGKVYECEYCVDKFISEAGMTRHVKYQHTKDFEQYTCDQCGTLFKEITRFNQHIKFHQRHKDLVCEICDKLFHARKTKVLHKKIIHDNIRNFACVRCEFKTVSNGKLNRHILKTHENQQEVCFLCNTVVKHAYHHVRSAHKDQPTAWKEFMDRKRVAMKLLKTKKVQDEKESSDLAASTDMDLNMLPSDFDIYPEH